MLECCRLQLTSFFPWLYCSLHFFAKNGVVILCVSLGIVQYWWISVGLVIVQLRAVFCPWVQYLSFFCEAFSWTILDSSSFPLFYSGQVSHELVYPVTVVLREVCFGLITLFSYPVFFCLFQAPLDVAVHVVVFLRSFRFESFPSQFSSFVAQIKNFRSDPVFFFFWRFLPMISLAVSVTAGWRLWSLNLCLYLHFFMIVTGANFPPVIAWRVFPTHWNLSGFRGQTWILCVLAFWFFLGECWMSSSASRGHFQCLLLENFLSWHCSLLIGSASSLECNQSSCVVKLCCARSIFWMLCDDQKRSPTQDR